MLYYPVTPVFRKHTNSGLLPFHTSCAQCRITATRSVYTNSSSTRSHDKAIESGSLCSDCFDGFLHPVPSNFVVVLSSIFPPSPRILLMFNPHSIFLSPPIITNELAQSKSPPRPSPNLPSPPSKHQNVKYSHRPSSMIISQPGNPTLRLLPSQRGPDYIPIPIPQTLTRLLPIYLPLTLIRDIVFHSLRTAGLPVPGSWGRGYHLGFHAGEAGSHDD